MPQAVQRFSFSPEFDLTSPQINNKETKKRLNQYKMLHKHNFCLKSHHVEPILAQRSLQMYRFLRDMCLSQHPFLLIQMHIINKILGNLITYNTVI